MSTAASILASEVRDGMQIDWDAPIAMDDGVVLRADLFRPIHAGRYPVILSCGPYAKWLHYEQLYPSVYKALLSGFPEVAQNSSLKYMNWETVDPEKWVPDGYVVVRVDSRGAGRSPGVLHVHSPRETQDIYQVIEWCAAQPWCNGRVGMNGISYYAMNQWRVAALKPPHLAAICAWEGASDRYREASRHGGIVTDFVMGWFARQILPVQHGLGERGVRSAITGDWVSGPETLGDDELARNRHDSRGDAIEHELDDEYYSSRSAALSQIEAPLLSAGNWGGHGLHLRGNVEGYLGAGSRDKRLEIHGEAHWAHFYTDYGVSLQKRFFGHFLQGRDTGWAKQPPVQLQVRHVSKFVQRHEDAWPIPRTRFTKLHLRSDGHELSSQPQERDDRLSFQALGHGLTFLSKPLQEETEFTGPLAAKLAITSSTSDADLFLVLRVFSPNLDEVVFQGASDPRTPVAQGWLRASHRKLDAARSLPYRPYHTHDERQPLIAGQVYELEVELWPTSIVVPAGYRIALSVRGRDYEYPNASQLPDPHGSGYKGCGPYVHPISGHRPKALFDNTTTLVLGAGHENSLLLPLIPRSAHAAGGQR
jgi:uncharacterized protein